MSGWTAQQRRAGSAETFQVWFAERPTADQIQDQRIIEHTLRRADEPVSWDEPLAWFFGVLPVYHIG